MMPAKPSAEVRAELRGKILEIEAAMLAMPGRQIEIPIKHHFAPGLYLREMAMPKGATLTGKIHRTEHYCILSQGEVSVSTEEGMRRIKAPAVIHSMPGMKRVLHAHEDVVWVNCHHNPSNERDLEKVEHTFVAETFEEFYLTSDRTLESALKILGVTPEALTAISENPEDQTPFHAEPAGMRIADSTIHGKGTFATKMIEKGEVIAPARLGGKRTPAGRYCNHGADPNAEMVMRENGDIDLVALKEIEPNAEILSDYYLNYVNSREGVKLCLS